jgi:uncharacterized membrane protein YciS (DUF1049 family)
MDVIIAVAVGFIAGVVFAGVFKIDIKFSKKEDYEAKVKELNQIIAGFENKEPVIYKKDDFFPADISKDYGIPKDLR